MVNQKKTGKIFICFLLLLMLCMAAVVTVKAAEGTVGSGISWVLDETNGRLTISGSGEIPDFGTPWSS